MGALKTAIYEKFPYHKTFLTKLVYSFINFTFPLPVTYVTHSWGNW